MKNQKRLISLFVCVLTLCISLLSLSAYASHPRLVVTAEDVVEMKSALSEPGSFRKTYESLTQQVDLQLTEAIVVPQPKDGGGGYTHEKHKSNYRLMHDAGLLYQLTGHDKYLTRVKDMLFEYAKLYPTLGVHPAAKSYSPGRIFWQSLNEAVWLVYTSQAYDFIVDGLTEDERQFIEEELIAKVAHFLSEGSPQSFNKIHNHGTWANAAVGMAGFVLDKPEWVDKSLLGTDLSGEGGFLRQLDELFSPDGYYNEGPYYQRYALMPFVLFAKAIQVNRPEMKIFEKRDGILLKAIDTTIQLSYNGLFFPINDAIKSKGINTIELVYGVSIAFGLTGNPAYLNIAQAQDSFLLTGDGLKVARSLDKGEARPYDFASTLLRDGRSGDQGALIVLRDGNGFDGSAVVFKSTSQGLGHGNFDNVDWDKFDQTANHGHFDKLNWQFYDNGNEIVVDYGAARFLNIVSKNGGHYLLENETYAKQTVAHNTLVVDETSHFDAHVGVAYANYPKINFFDVSDNITIASATMDEAYEDLRFTRTLAMINVAETEHPIVVDLISVDTKNNRKLDMPLHYNGTIVNLNFDVQSNKKLRPLGKDNGYQHLWLKAQAKPDPGLLSITWLNDNRFYTHTTISSGELQVLFTELGANDPNFNLLPQQSFILRNQKASKFDFVSVLEPHGDYNPAMEYTKGSSGRLTELKHESIGRIDLIEFGFDQGNHYLLAISRDRAMNKVEYKGKSIAFSGHYSLIKL